ncbi:hypothetical protein [Pyrodictium abyssi]|uniref:Antitoxin n=1 Tax=Pyrodictium abyssi TaxID=54256 RepID=A0ABN6ZT28_9CREN|nr:hypothetical protein PABY_14170 [Pyrodictium abyssi]
MPRRTTVILEDDVYEKLVEESVKRYGTARAISRVLNELLREAFRARKELLELIYSEKLVYIDEEEFEETRRELSERLATR